MVGQEGVCAYNGWALYKWEKDFGDMVFVGNFCDCGDIRELRDRPA
jgi:hypothetical protein